jgi:hypothetical protein
MRIIISLSDTIRDAYASSVFRYWFHEIFGGASSFIRDHTPLEEYHRICEKNKK